MQIHFGMNNSYHIYAYLSRKFTKVSENDIRVSYICLSYCCIQSCVGVDVWDFHLIVFCLIAITLSVYPYYDSGIISGVIYFPCEVRIG